VGEADATAARSLEDVELVLQGEISSCSTARERTHRRAVRNSDAIATAVRTRTSWKPSWSLRRADPGEDGQNETAKRAATCAL
jgi:hypothetical protein